MQIEWNIKLRFELNREIFIDTQLKFHELKIPVEKKLTEYAG